MANYGTPIHILQTDFRSGELDPDTSMRVDSQVYRSGARSLKNCLIHNTGSASRRPGTTQLNTLSKRSRLLEYTFDENERYVMAFQNGQLEIFDEIGNMVDSFTEPDAEGAVHQGEWTDNTIYLKHETVSLNGYSFLSTLEHTSTPATEPGIGADWETVWSMIGVCPWDESSMWTLTIKAFANTVFICNATFRTKVLIRTSLDSFEMEDYSFNQSTSGENIFQPYYKFEPFEVTLQTDSYVKGPVNVVSSDPIFNASWIGDTIRIHGKEIDVVGFTDAHTIFGDNVEDRTIDLDPEPFRTIEGSGLVEVTFANHGLKTGDSIVLADSTSVASITAAQLNGTHVITYKDEDVFHITTGGSATISADGGGPSVTIQSNAPTRIWDEQVYSTRRGWPQAVELHGNRLWFGGSTELPDGMFGSVIGGYFNFDAGDGDDTDSPQFTVASSVFAKIRHIVSANNLLAFSEQTEFAVEQREGTPITPSNASIRSQTKYGATYWVHPKFFDGAVLFGQRNGQTIREYIYDFSTDSYISNDISAVANHLLDAPYDFDTIIGTATRPEQYAIFVNFDGTIAVYHSIRQEKLQAWSRWETVKGYFDSVCTLGNKAFVSCYREIDDQFHLERVELDDDRITVDYSLNLNVVDPPTDTFDIGTDYDGETVKVLSNGKYLGEFLIGPDGILYLDEVVDNIAIGFDYGVEIIPNPPDKEMTDGAWTGSRRRINAVIAHFRNCRSASINDNPVIAIRYGDDFSEGTSEYDGKVKTFMFGYDRDPTIKITQEEPVRMTVLGLVMEVTS